MKIRLSQKEDIEDIMILVNQAKQYFKENHIDQWQYGYPEDIDFLADIDKQKSYVLVDDKRIVATMYFNIEEDPNYQIIDGQWLTQQPYGVMHRIVVDNQYKGKGLAKKLLDYSITQLKQQDVFSLRIDTHHDNQSMQRFLIKNGFVPCGTITVEDGTPRIAFEKLLGKDE